jgi:hypothetical protein
VWLCPLCGKEVGDKLYHLRFDHDIQDKGQYDRAIERQNQLASYVDQLQADAKHGKITWEDFRRLRDEWEKEHAEH